MYIFFRWQVKLSWVKYLSSAINVADTYTLCSQDAFTYDSWINQSHIPFHFLIYHPFIVIYSFIYNQFLMIYVSTINSIYLFIDLFTTQTLLISVSDPDEGFRDGDRRRRGVLPYQQPLHLCDERVRCQQIYPPPGNDHPEEHPRNQDAHGNPFRERFHYVGHASKYPSWRHNIETITVTSQWARRRLNSPASWLFAQPFVQAQIKENIKAPRHWPLWGESTGDRWISPHKGPVTRKMFSFDDVIMVFRITGPLWGDSTNWIPLRKGQ